MNSRNGFSLSHASVITVALIATMVPLSVMLIAAETNNDQDVRARMAALGSEALERTRLTGDVPGFGERREFSIPRRALTDLPVTSVEGWLRATPIAETPGLVALESVVGYSSSDGLRHLERVRTVIQLGQGGR